MRRTLPLILLCLLVLSACRVHTSVTVRVDDDGSGTVTARVVLDEDAVRLVEAGGIKLEDAVQLGDLEAAEWRSSGWRRLENGGATLEVSKDFVRAEDAGPTVAELNGPDGPVRDVEVVRNAETFRTEWSFSGVADLKDLKTGIEGDADLVARLVAERVDIPDLDARLRLQTHDALRLEVTADLPSAESRTFAIPLGTRVVMEESSSHTATFRLALMVGGAALAIVALAILAVGAARGRRRRRRRVQQAQPYRSVALFEDPTE